MLSKKMPEIVAISSPATPTTPLDDASEKDKAFAKVSLRGTDPRDPETGLVSRSAANEDGSGSHNRGAAGVPVVPVVPVAPVVDSGYRPWKVVVGCFCLVVPIYGLLSSIGLFQTYWREHQLQKHSESDIAWIISLFGFFDCLFAAPAGCFFDIWGSRILLPVGSIIYTLSFLALAFASTYGQFMACFVLAGMSAAICTTIAFSVISQWFRAREGIATGCVTLGAALGGIFFASVLQSVFEHYQWNTAILILFGIIGGFMALGNLMVDTNDTLHPGNTSMGPMDSMDLNRHQQHQPGEAPSAPKTKQWERATIFRMIKSPRFWLVSYAVFTFEFIVFIQWATIPSYAVATNNEENQFYLMMAFNIGAVLGRTLPPWMSDRWLGPVNTVITMNAFTLLVVLLIWLPVGASTVQALFVVVVLMGVGAGSFAPLEVACITSLAEPGFVGTWLGSVFTVISVAILTGSPAAEAILAKHGSTSEVSFLAGVLVSGLIALVALRWVCHDRQWVWRRRI